MAQVKKQYGFKKKIQTKSSAEIEKERIEREVKLAKINERELIAEWRQKLRVAKSKDFDDEAENLIKQTVEKISKNLQRIEERFEQMQKSTMDDLNLESEFVENVQKTAGEYQRWASTICTQHSANMDELISTHNTNLQQFRNYYSSVEKKIEEQVDEKRRQLHLNDIRIENEKKAEAEQQKALMELEQVQSDKTFVLLNRRDKLIQQWGAAECAYFEEKLRNLQQKTSIQQKQIEEKEKCCIEYQDKLTIMKRELKSLENQVLDVNAVQSIQRHVENTRRQIRQRHKSDEISLTKLAYSEFLNQRQKNEEDQQAKRRFHIQLLHEMIEGN